MPGAQVSAVPEAFVADSASVEALDPTLGTKARRLARWCSSFAAMSALETAEASDISRERVSYSARSGPRNLTTGLADPGHHRPAPFRRDWATRRGCIPSRWPPPGLVAVGLPLRPPWSAVRVVDEVERKGCPSPLTRSELRWWQPVWSARRPRPVPVGGMPIVESGGVGRIDIEHLRRIEAVTHRRLEATSGHVVEPVEAFGGEGEPQTGGSESRGLEGRHAPIRPHHKAGVRWTGAQPLVRPAAEREGRGRLDVGAGERPRDDRHGRDSLRCSTGAGVDDVGASVCGARCRDRAAGHGYDGEHPAGVVWVLDADLPGLVGVA